MAHMIWVIRDLRNQQMTGPPAERTSNEIHNV